MGVVIDTRGGGRGTIVPPSYRCEMPRVVLDRGIIANLSSLLLSLSLSIFSSASSVSRLATESSYLYPPRAAFASPVSKMVRVLSVPYMASLIKLSGWPQPLQALVMATPSSSQPNFPRSPLQGVAPQKKVGSG